MSCCSCAKHLLIFFNLIIWLTGGAFLSCGILVLFKRDLNELFSLLSHDSRLIPSFHNIGYILLGVGALIFIVGLLGCCGSVRGSRSLLGLYVFFIILVMGGELIIAMYTVLLSDEWDARLPKTLQKRILTYNYSTPQRFERDLDGVQRQFACCGIDGPLDFQYNPDYKLFDRHLPPSCCMSLLNGICLEVDAYRTGCYQAVNDHIHFYSKLIVAAGLSIALIELTALISAVCLCRNTLYDDDFD
ncbi:unnamed protein product [Adineta ricciae]|uniref:Tetraspanin n=1 Tax=Adineta ricciae TaxID=249248 RepID=A0A813NRU5_ADIRI|nr:unnamed protein product [Adineta ricciae]CAF1658573.1 unnamed protein product [Adineta ricciae]